MRMDIAAQTDIGRRKKNNEDYYGVFREDTPGLELFREGAMLCVADGLGGHMGGEIASKLAVATLKDVLKQSPTPPDDDKEDQDDSGILTVLREGMQAANENVYKTNQDLVRHKKPMGTTLLAAVIEEKKVYIANIGDSRAYHLRNGEIIGQTEDHSWVDEQVKLGLMSRAEAETDHRRNIVTRSVGTNPEVEIDTYLWHVVPGDIVMLCTDGLVNMVKDTEIQQIFQKRYTSAEAVRELVNLANANGGRDNITVVVAQMAPSPLVFLTGFWRRYTKEIVGTAFAILWGALCFAAGYYVRGLVS